MRGHSSQRKFKNKCKNSKIRKLLLTLHANCQKGDLLNSGGCSCREIIAPTIYIKGANFGNISGKLEKEKSETPLFIGISEV